MVATSMSAIVAVVIVSVLAIARRAIVAIITRVRVRQSLSHSKEGNGNNGQEADKLEHVGGVGVCLQRSEQNDSLGVKVSLIYTIILLACGVYIEKEKPLGKDTNKEVADNREISIRRFFLL